MGKNVSLLARLLRIALSGLLLVVPQLSLAKKSTEDYVCAPEKMVRIELAFEWEGQSEFAKLPKVIYRYTNQYGRVEEQKNPDTGLHLLIIVDEPRLWYIDLEANYGKSMRDPGPDYNFRFPLLEGIARDEKIRALQGGCEIEQISEFAKSETVDYNGAPATRYRYITSGERLEFYVRDGVPLRMELFQENIQKMAINYLDYQNDLEFDPALFAKLPDVIYR